jgi:hypothetical protein
MERAGLWVHVVLRTHVVIDLVAPKPALRLRVTPLADMRLTGLNGCTLH